MKKLLFVLLLLASVFAVELHEGGWILGTNKFGAGPNEITPTLNYDGTLRLTLDSTARSKALFKLLTVYDTPTNQSYTVEFDVRVNAPNIDLDYGRSFGTGGEGIANDGPNLFAFAYDYNESTLTDLPLSSTSLTFYDKHNSLCHVHLECNWAAAIDQAYDFYCTSPGPTYVYSGWVYDAKKFGLNVKINEVAAEAFQSNDWKTIRLYLDAGECVQDVTTLMIMGVDTLADKPYTWEIKNAKLVTSEEILLPLDYIYMSNGSTYTRLEKPAYCGDGEKGGTEECDGTDGVDTGWECTSTCTLQPKCGDNKIVGNEICDGLKHTPGFTCASNCTTEIPVCGDNQLVANEVCDGTKTPTGFTCAADCLTMSPICGDGIVVGTEECDGTNGTTAEFNCTSECGLYRILTDKEQEGFDGLIELIESSEVGVPSTTQMTIPKGIYSAEDFKDQFVLKSKTLDGNVSFCTVGITACESRYIMIEDAFATETGISPVDDLKGIAKVYKAEVNVTDPTTNTTTTETMYYIGFKGGTGLLPYIEMDTTMWVVVGGLIVLIIGALVVLLLILGGYMYYNKGKGFKFKKFFK